MATYYVATRALYVLVDAEDEIDARERALTAFRGFGTVRPVVIRTIRLATEDEIEFDRQVADELLDCKPLLDPVAQDQTDWTPMIVPGSENEDGTESPTAWFAYNRATRQSISFANFKEASAFCFHPENRR